MRGTLASASTLLVIFVALGACGSPTPQETARVPAQQTGPTTREGPPVIVAPPRAVVPSGPAPTLSIVGAPEAIGDAVAISITNRGAGPAELGTRVAIEVERNGTFAAAQPSLVTLRYDCAQEAPACVTLAPGAELIPPPWLGTWGDMQCRCLRCAPVEAGTYRFVVTTCDGAHRIEGTPFTLTR